MAVISPDDINQLVFAMQTRSDSYFIYYLDKLRVGLTAMNALPGMARENKHRRATPSVITTLNVVRGNMKLSLCGSGGTAALDGRAVRFSPQPLYPRGKSHQPQSWYGRFGGHKTLSNEGCSNEPSCHI
jgi:hypothetical protein